VLENELGTAASLAGGMPEALDWDAAPGRPSPAAVRAAAGGQGPYYALRTTLLCLENTHNAAGGTVTPVATHAELVATAREAGLRVHLDGARLWHAAVALGVPPCALVGDVDSVQVCLSKGLGAPVGSLVAGSAEFVTEARRVRKMLGGGVRQGGVLAAAGLVALEDVDRLAEDHANAAALADGLAGLGWRVRPPETNIVLAGVADLPGTLRRLAELGVLAFAMAGQVRFVTHRDVTAGDVREVIRRLASA
jgi:threonine aldolase